jgi:hypothetical protein
MNDMNLLDNSVGYIKKWCEALNLQTFGLLDNE